MGKIHGRSDINMIIGLETDKAKKHIESLGMEFRIMQNGSKSHLVSGKFNDKRVNVHVDKGYVIDIFNIG